MNPFREKTEYALLCGLIGLLKILPTSLVEGFFKLFGALFFLLSFRRRSFTLTNLKIAFPEKRFSERFGIAWRSFQNMALFTGDSFLILAGKLTPDMIRTRVDETHLDKYRAIKASAKNGIIHLTGHLGNWELLGNYGAVRGLESHVVARKGNNSLIDEKVIVPMRTRYGNKVFYKENAMINTVKALKRNQAVSFLIDQKIGRKEGVAVTFFGQEILAVASCAVLQLRFHPVVVPTFMIKTGYRKYKWLVGDPIEWTDDGSSKEEQIQKLTQRYQSIIEETIRAYPDQWFWMHNRFKLMNARTRRRKKRRASERAARRNRPTL
jgi:KDO2-lipid IV(A) lauroyltransferase